jgi:3-hydroxymyristoyl/3-hydroxydecanoyl-(acyl carrier protein) dehydratase
MPESILHRIDDFMFKDLPHQIPFRVASKLIRREPNRIEGEFLCTANDEMPLAVMLVEAMAQFGGALVFDAQGYLSAIDSCEVTRLPEAGDVVQIEVSLDASLGALHRFSAIGRVGGVEVARARFYLSANAEA